MNSEYPSHKHLLLEVIYARLRIQQSCFCTRNQFNGLYNVQINALDAANGLLRLPFTLAFMCCDTVITKEESGEIILVSFK